MVLYAFYIFQSPTREPVHMRIHVLLYTSYRKTNWPVTPMTRNHCRVFLDLKALMPYDSNEDWSWKKMNWLHYNPAAIQLPICGGCQEFTTSAHTHMSTSTQLKVLTTHPKIIWFIRILDEILNVRNPWWRRWISATEGTESLLAIKAFQHFCIK